MDKKRWVFFLNGAIATLGVNHKSWLLRFSKLQETRYGSWMNVKQSGSISCGLLSRINQVYNFFLLVFREFWTTVSDATLLARCIKTIACAFAQHRTLELRKGSNDLHHHAATGRGGVNDFGQAAEARSNLGV